MIQTIVVYNSYGNRLLPRVVIFFFVKNEKFSRENENLSRENDKLSRKNEKFSRETKFSCR